MVKPIAKVIFLSAGLLSVAGTASYASTLLTGEVASAQSQTVTAPKSTGWQIQIQWLEEEGTIVKEGDLVAVFDSGGIQTQLEENQENLQTQKLQLLKIEMDVNQAVVEAEGRLKLATIQVKKDRIEANIPKGEVSDYEKGKFIIAYEKALMEQIKAEENLKLKLAERDVAIQKQKIEIIKLEEKIAYQLGQIDKLSVRAHISGPVSHLMHPWMPQKIAAGMNVQPAWEVVRVQAQSSYQVTSWVHEIDAAKMDLANNTLQLTLDAYPGKSYPGKLLSMSSQAEQRSQWSESAYYRLEIAFDEAVNHPIFPGMSVRINLQ
ncbi:MAG: HlyD family efflux transporter periplasmic adaptor subunit [Paraglaciecola sp.]|uniref:HlyD family secretion protein n=1 Tax=Paraglaciecola sp. TaxID=1920173 RepID=UPI00273DA1CA|nr:HlyD family efflux transporter periplasmic adaptor subunit [Paraglaciecola sp.]MDP5031363.1 HlyD family efflux transporter periplasmic adaptor subunit [Paraglaciecola sp.]MDP5040721.1 HlyD family efflux transporter periplasmic adaptor subunit [Paraglaciecola sp.]MDP5132285.1 HlyD family efflux transporter periplasmic adaptor subunit [Paraglaciecola sp.]